MTASIPVIDRAQAEELRINVVPSFSHRYGEPVPFPHEDIVGVCIGCGRGLTDQDAVVECQCWSGVISRSLPCLMCTRCHEEVTNEL